MSEIFDDVSSTSLTLDAYRADLRVRRLELGAGQPSWKLERQQYFADTTDPPSAAFARGEWEESIRLMEDNRPLFAKYCREAADHGVALYRVRVVEEPMAPYVQWEFHYLRLATAAGERIRVVDAERLGQFERNGPLPDVLTAGADTIYRILYTDDGVPDAVRRIVSRGAAGRCIDLIRRLYDAGEDMDAFFERRVARLSPPRLV
jgi:hypothetical protein